MDDSRSNPTQSSQEASGEVLTREQLAVRWGYRNAKTVDRLIKSKKADAPRFFRIGARVLFRLSDIQDFEKSRLVRRRPF